MGRPAASAARDTRQLILDAALDLFAERGYHATSMRALAGAVGVRESAIYHYFESKEAILGAVVEEHFRARVAIAERVVSGSPRRPLADLLASLAARLLEHMQEPDEKKLMRIAMSLGPRFLGEQQSPLVRLRQNVRAPFHRIIDQLQRQGKVRKDVDREAFMLAFGAPLLVLSGVMWGARPPIPISTSRFIKAHAAMMARAIGVAR